MECSEVRAALSARLDGEEAKLPDDLVDAHLEACSECQQWYATVTALGRNLRMGTAQAPAGPQIDAEQLAQSVLSTAEQHPSVFVGMRRRTLPLMLGRIALGVLALVYVLWGGYLLFSPTGGLLSNAVETSSDPATSGFIGDAATARFALAGGLVWTAWRPKVASGVLPIYLGLFAFSAGFAARDIIVGLVESDSVATDIATPVFTVVVYAASALALLVVWLARHHVFTPLRQSLRMMLAQPVTFSPGDVQRNSNFRLGDRRPPSDGQLE